MYVINFMWNTLVAGAVSDDATRTIDEIEAHLDMLIP